MSSAFPFLRLPLELRELVYSHHFHPASRLQEVEYYGGGQYKFDFDIYHVNKQIYYEAQTVFRRQNVFVRVETPWPQAVNHIAHEGLCPIVAAHDAARRFRYHHGLVQISAVTHLIRPEHSVILLLEDLHLFCNVWYYSALNYESLNQHLRVLFKLQDPYYPADPKPIPIAIQNRLLLPFGQLKDCDEVEVVGYDESVKKELDRLMAIPYPSPQECCENAANFMEQGDTAIGEGRAEDALELYIKSFHAIHILIDGRTRRVLADQFFDQAITDGRYKGQTGTTVRVILPIMLVSRVVNAHLKLQHFEAAVFWGMRSIRIMRSTVGTDFEDILIEFADMLDVGMMYLRTGIALKKMEENDSEELDMYADDDEVGSSEKCFGFAKSFLKGPHQKAIKKELDDNSVSVPESVFLDSDSRSDVDSMAPMHSEEAEADAEVAASGSVPQ